MSGSLSTLVRKLRNLPNVDRFSLFWFSPNLLLFLIASVALRLFSFRMIAPWLGQDQHSIVAVPLVTKTQLGRARQIRKAVQLAARHSFWRSDCFPQAIAALVLLRLYDVPHGLYYGARLSDDVGANGMNAHVWVASGPVAVTGGRGFGKFGILASFAWPRMT